MVTLYPDNTDQWYHCMLITLAMVLLYPDDIIMITLYPDNTDPCKHCILITLTHVNTVS